jgi:hypothetical protein
MPPARARHRHSALGAVCALAAVLSGCGLQVASPDLFALTRTGPGPKLSMVVNDSGTISCNGEPAKPLADPLLLQARSLADSLATDAQDNLRLARSGQSVFSYAIKLQQGTVVFSDTSAHGRSELTQAETFVLAAASGACGLQS